MILISHRGNVFGANPERENSPEYVKEALSIGYSVEVDVWCINNHLFLGHDFPKHEIGEQFLENKSILCHAKNVGALMRMAESGAMHYFWHEKDKYTITSKGYVLSYPGLVCNPSKSIIMGPEHYCNDIKNAYAICSDYIGSYESWSE